MGEQPADEVAERLRLLAQRHRAGLIDDLEYASAKRALLGDPAGPRFAQETVAVRAVDSPTLAARSSRAGVRLIAVAVAAAVALMLLVVMFWPR